MNLMRLQQREAQQPAAPPRAQWHGICVQLEEPGKDVEMICDLSLSRGISLPNWVSLVWFSHPDELRWWHCLSCGF